MTFDPGQFALLAVAGVIYDIFGALLLSRALMWSRPQDLAGQTVGTSWAGNADLLRALCEQTTDARWGAGLLILGFALQAASSLGLKIDGLLFAILIAVALLLLISYQLSRNTLVKRQYMKAVDASDGEEGDKAVLRRSFDTKPGNERS
jgi:hypothetical protein